MEKWGSSASPGRPTRTELCGNCGRQRMQRAPGPLHSTAGTRRNKRVASGAPVPSYVPAGTFGERLVAGGVASLFLLAVVLRMHGRTTGDGPHEILALANSFTGAVRGPGRRAGACGFS